MRSFVCLTTLAVAAARGGMMGHNTYDALNGAGDASYVYDAAAYMSQNLLSFGWDTLFLDAGWSSGIDGYGRQVPSTTMYPDGFAKMIDDIHSVGLKFGVWTIRGIPKAAVEANLPIFGSNYHAQDAARLDTNCSWDADNLGVLPNAAGQAYYASVAQWYASLGIDYVKIDCMVSDEHGLYTDDFTTFATAMKAAGIDITVSPGTSMNPANGTYIATNKLARHYRVTNDMWDCWRKASPTQSYPTCVADKLTVLPQYAGIIGVNDAYPDPDMLPLGVIMHQNATGGGIYGPPSATHLTQAEQRTLMSLALITRVPLIFGGKLPLDANDTFTLSLMTNIETLTVHNASSYPTPITATGGDEPHAWTAVPDAIPGPAAYVALFNAGDSAATVTINTADAALPSGYSWCVRDLWARAPVSSTPVTATFSTPLSPHDAGLYLLTPAQGASC